MVTPVCRVCAGPLPRKDGSKEWSDDACWDCLATYLGIPKGESVGHKTVPLTMFDGIDPNLAETDFEIFGTWGSKDPGSPSLSMGIEGTRNFPDGLMSYCRIWRARIFFPWTQAYGEIVFDKDRRLQTFLCSDTRGWTRRETERVQEAIRLLVHIAEHRGAPRGTRDERAKYWIQVCGDIGEDRARDLFKQECRREGKEYQNEYRTFWLDYVHRRLKNNRALSSAGK